MNLFTLILLLNTIVMSGTVVITTMRFEVEESKAILGWMLVTGLSWLAWIPYAVYLINRA